MVQNNQNEDKNLNRLMYNNNNFAFCKIRYKKKCFKKNMLRNNKVNFKIFLIEGIFFERSLIKKNKKLFIIKKIVIVLCMYDVLKLIDICSHRNSIF